MLGALNAITQEIVTVTTDSYINAQSVITLLQKLKVQYADLPITVVLDNARYQRCEAVTTAAESLQIELQFLPPYSPNLNLIERLWKYVKKECLNSKYHTTFAEFKAVIMGCVTSTDLRQRQQLASLLTLNFQMFDKKLNLDPRQKWTIRKNTKLAA